MTEEKMSPLRERMIEDMRIRGMSPKTQHAHIRAVRYFAEFIGRSPDMATPDDPSQRGFLLPRFVNAGRTQRGKEMLLLGPHRKTFRIPVIRRGS